MSVIQCSDGTLHVCIDKSTLVQIIEYQSVAEFGKMKDYLWDINFDVKLQMCATMRMTSYCLLLPLYAIYGPSCKEYVKVMKVEVNLIRV